MAAGTANQQPQQQSPRSSSPRIVSFVVDKERVVDAEVLNQHPDGSLDLRGAFNQEKWKDKPSIDERTGEESTVFTEPEKVADPTISVRYRVRPADEEEVRVGKLTPGTFFERGVQG